MGNISTWATTAAGNDTGSPPDYPVEGMAPSTVNNTMREMMAAEARQYRDTQGSLATGGAGNAYTLTTNSGYAALTDISLLVFRVTRTNSGAATLDVDGLGAKPIYVRGGNDLAGGVIREDAIVAVAYNSTTDGFDLVAPTQNATQLAGELPDSALSDNVPLKDANNDFTGTNTFDGVATSDWARLSQVNTFEARQEVRSTGATHLLVERTGSDNRAWKHIISENGDYLIRASDDSLSDGEALFVTDRSGLTLDGLDLLPEGGELQYGGIEVGYRGAPSRSITASATTAASDAGGTIRMTGGSGQTLTLDSDPDDDSLVFLLNTSGNDWTIAASGTLTQGGTGTTGNRTLSGDAGMATAYHDSSGNWYISGTGLS